MSDYKIGTPGTLPFLSESEEVPGGYPVPAETRVATDQSTVFGDGSSLSPLRATGGGPGAISQRFEVSVSTFTDPNGFDVALPVAMADGTWIPEVILQPPNVDSVVQVFVLSRTNDTLRLGATDNFADGTILLITLGPKTN